MHRSTPVPVLLSFAISWSLCKLMSTDLVMPSNHLYPLSPPSPPALNLFPVSGSPPMSQLFASRGQSIGASASASVLPMNIQGQFPLGLTGLILQFKGLSNIFSTSQFDSIDSLVFSLSYGTALIPIHDHWKNYSFDYIDLCWQSSVSAF